MRQFSWDAIVVALIIMGTAVVLILLAITSPKANPPAIMENAAGIHEYQHNTGEYVLTRQHNRNDNY